MGKTSFYYNGEFLGEIENLIVTDGINATLEIEMPNERNRANLKAQIDVLSDGHQDIALKAADANRVLVELDTRMANGTGPSIFSRAAGRHLTELEILLEAQEARIRRVREEISEIRKNIRVI